MATLQEFGELQSVELRKCWSDEARDLTPWVASPAGLKLLGDALGVELACENCEVAVGPFSADISRQRSDDQLTSGDRDPAGENKSRPLRKDAYLRRRAGSVNGRMGGTHVHR